MWVDSDGVEWHPRDDTVEMSTIQLESVTAEPDLEEAPQGPQEASTYAQELAHAYVRLKAQRAAKRLLDTESAGPAPALDIATLGAVLKRPPLPRHRIDTLMTYGSNTTVVAAQKTGKTTLLLSLIRCLLTGEAFLGRFEVRPISDDATIALISMEMNDRQLARWADDAGIDHDRLLMVNMRGQASPFSSDAAYRELAQQLKNRNVEVLLLDSFSRAFTGDQNSVSEVQPWLNMLDRFKVAVAARELILVVHAGWEGERSRGSSALQDWPDAVWTMTKDDDGQRYLKVTGRDVELDESQLAYDPATRLLRLSGAGSRKAAAKTGKLAELADELVQLATAQPGLSGYQLEQLATTPKHKGDTSQALAQAVAEGRLVVTPGPRRAKLYSIASPTPTYPHLPPRGEVVTYPHPPKGMGVGDGGCEPLDIPPTLDTQEVLS